ncbi:MAG: crotonase/enoyl-CoA hydratase family protein [Acidimicrobiales bacterium]
MSSGAIAPEVTPSSDVVLYEERDDLAFITLNRPEKKNTLTEAVIQGLADGVDRATASGAARAIGLRGAGGVFSAGYDLTAEGGWTSPFDAPHPEARPGAWDPVRDLQFMGHNVRRFMKIWECPNPVIGQVEGWAVGGATDLVLCCDQLFMADDAVIGYPPARIFGTPTTALWLYRLGLERTKQYLLTGCEIDADTALRIGLVSEVHPAAELGERVEAHARRFAKIPANQLALNKLLVNQAVEAMGLRSAQLLGTFFDGVTRHTEEAYRWMESFGEHGFREVIRERDRPWHDYGER